MKWWISALFDKDTKWGLPKNTNSLICKNRFRAKKVSQAILYPTVTIMSCSQKPYQAFWKGACFCKFSGNGSFFFRLCIYFSVLVVSWGSQSEIHFWSESGVNIAARFAHSILFYVTLFCLIQLKCWRQFSFLEGHFLVIKGKMQVQQWCSYSTPCGGVGRLVD